MKTRTSLFLTTGLAAAAFATFGIMGTSSNAAEKLNVEEVRGIVKNYLDEHPEIVIEAIEAYQANQQEIEARQFKETIQTKQDELHSKNLPFIGNPDGDIVIVEFFDYNCGYCKRAMGEITQLIEKDDKVKVIFHEMPILSESSADAARYALAAHKQGKYFEYHQALMTFAGAKTPETLEKVGSDLGLDVEKLKKDADSKDVRGEVEKSLALSRDLGIRGTPAFIIGDVLTPGYMTFQNMQTVIEQIRNDKG
ncbi:MAG: DsbA family protein [Rhodospirillales bacterium]|nr:DsbA family protein [Rhodospirillales bacterium]MCB9997198.1 DsbA family protein [Rhodospirillales bacterium]